MKTPLALIALIGICLVPNAKADSAQQKRDRAISNMAADCLPLAIMRMSVKTVAKMGSSLDPNESPYDHDHDVQKMRGHVHEVALGKSNFKPKVTNIAKLYGATQEKCEQSFHNAVIAEKAFLRVSDVADSTRNRVVENRDKHLKPGGASVGASSGSPGSQADRAIK